MHQAEVKQDKMAMQEKKLKFPSKQEVEAEVERRAIERAKKTIADNNYILAPDVKLNLLENGEVELV